MFEKEAEEYVDTESKYLIEDNEGNIINIAKKVKQAFKDGAEFGYNKAAEKISVLLSCKDCPENKDGLICQKEYENKCLAQKIQFIKELQQENAELKEEVETSYEVYNNNLDYSYHIEEQLTEAKKIIEELYNIIPASMSEYAKEPMEHARKFLTEEADKCQQGGMK